MYKHLLIFISLSSHAFISTDTAVLMELVTTTASQLNELEKLVSNAERYTEKMQRYNELAQDEYFRAQRVAYLAEDIASKKKIEDLGTLNSAIKDLKYSMSDLKTLLDEYKVIQEDEGKTKSELKIKAQLNKHKKVRANNQIKRSISVRTQSGANRLTAQNTAILLEQGVEAQNNQLKLIEQNAVTNRLLAEELEIKRKKELERKRFYGVAHEE
ncbi:hypothetical protein DAY19_11635 [Halobacteriovorax vibrionivorans]|uniref:Uncharacterized protein n=1 Tax=Halobacteriovorax vibrionivorans TaxID=2152716 RepID=A0ABY0IDS4_9BACT|nr:MULTISPECIES: hypothetical protein [Halobacteriovorax]RZF20630.1 hypothetical protein DAY19_11635 [Halobacteriovorax vibrionivorans]TGD48959.1 hypothetical protein EP118_02095 [Halobacteriovorax sp. Y22]